MNDRKVSNTNKVVRLMQLLWKRIRSYAHIKEDTDYQATIEYISKSVIFRGINMWVLFFAIIVASVGLNVNSTAVIIGAMLISPLMGPINGVGLAIGTFDDDLLLKSIKNLTVMVVISLVASTLYFLISPISDAQSELLARTQPTIFDVFIAFFGGLAGIVATSRKSQSITVMSGVAIATALMPPLCTAGYGIATGQLWYFLGAFYLFFINSFFIALATYLMVRFLGFPMKHYVDPKRKLKVKRLITLFTILIMIPSIFLAFDVVKESKFNSQTIKFVDYIQTQSNFKNIQLIKADRQYHHRSQTVTLFLIGRTLSNDEVNELQTLLHDRFGLAKAKLLVKQTEGGTVDITKQNEIIEDIINKKDATIAEQDSTIAKLEKQLSKAQNAVALSEQITKEAYAQYPNIRKFAISDMTIYDPQTLEYESTPIVYIQWSNGAHGDLETKIVQWLKVRLDVDDVRIVTLH